jgi:hypothetical protein
MNEPPIGRDSVNPLAIPVDGTDYAMGYVNGRISTWPASGWARFPNARLVRIDTQGSDPSADVLDVEQYDATILDAVTWVRQKLALNGDYLPVLYANRSTLTPLFNVLNANGYYVAKHFRLGIATLDGTKTVPDMTGVTYVQYAGAAATGANYDQSLIYDPSWKAVPEAGTGPVAGYRAVSVVRYVYPVPWNSTIAGIAAHYGYGDNWPALWDDPANALLREKRGEPNLIQAGDVVYVKTG